MVATFTLLALAIVALWFGEGDRASRARRYLWLWIGAASVPLAILSGVLEPVGLLAIAAFAAAAYAFSRTDAGRAQRITSAILLIVGATALMTHVVPGVTNPVVIASVRFSPDAIPFTLHLNYDKPLVGLFILGWCHARISGAADWRAMIAATTPWAAGLIAVLVVFALLAGYVRFDPKFPRETWLWLGGNLLFTCVAEEAFFRGFIQAGLQRLWKNRPRGQVLALSVAAILFGLGHAGGGAVYVVLATVAGLGYGWVYQRTGRIEASILTHFALNTVHFVAFTYPALQN